MVSQNSETYDGIIIGSGHNSLVLQAYLGKAGLEVLCAESRDVAGGGLATIEDPHHPGFLHNTHSFFHRGLSQMPWYRDLELERHGARYLEPELNVALVLKSRQVLEWWKSFERTEESFAQFDRNDARTLRHWRERFLPIVQKILIPESQSPPIPADRRRALLERSVEGRLLLEVSALSPLEFVLKEFKHPVIQAGLLFFNGLREVDLRCKGFGHHIPSLLASTAKAQMCLGGSAALARALLSAVGEAGGDVKVQVRPRKILIENGRAAGITTQSGDVFRARHFVASGLNPQQTFLELIDEQWISAEWRRKAQGYLYNLVAPLFALNLNLNEPPDYQAAAENPELKNAFMVILGLERFDQFLEIVRHHEAGTIPPMVMWGSCPTQFDPTQAPPQKHTAFMWEKLPYALDGDPLNWDRERVSHGESMLSLWTEYAPNLRRTILDWFVRSPLDTERTLANMVAGDLLVGSFEHGQVGDNRPFPGAGHYRAHVPGLYLCGSSCHPGGNVTGLVGYNSAQVILSDLGLAAPWAPTSVEGHLERIPS